MSAQALPAQRLADLAGAVGAELHGDPERRILGIAPLADAGPDELGFVARKSFLAQLPDTRAGAVLLEPAYRSRCPVDALATEDPYLAYAIISQLFERAPKGIHSSARIHPSARIGARAFIGAGVVIGAECVLGPDGQVFANAVLGERVVIGARVRVQSGAVIGADGFGYAADAESRWVRIAQLGSVRIGDDVDIGANAAIDRGALSDTVIGDGVKIDNLVHIAHNVRIGEHTAIAAGVGIAGGAEIGARCQLGGLVGVGGYVKIADGVSLTGMSMAAKDLDSPGVYSSGVPAMPNAAWRRNAMRFKHLDALYRHVQKLVNRPARNER